ncbi:MAG TPA: hypothetical protein VEX68_09965 [Bryobacteraceae bacterium]|nr:hypothetical protein [Bryobacteraceae bacterium]
MSVVKRFPPFCGIRSHYAPAHLRSALDTMLCLRVVVPNLCLPHAHYHHLKHLNHDIIEGGLIPYECGAIRVPDGSGLGVRLHRDKLCEYRELYQRLGSYP